MREIGKLRAMDRNRMRGLLAVAVACVASGLVFLTVPYLDNAQFATLTHLAGKIESVRRLSPPGSVNPSLSVVLSNSSGKHAIRIESYEGHVLRLARLSLGAFVDAWVDHDPTGAMFAWQIERNGEVLVGYRSRLEVSRQLQHRIAFIGWPLLGAGILLILGVIHYRIKTSPSRSKLDFYCHKNNKRV
jgi:hypothetical protein